jgi:hypothetical protein
MLTRYRYSKQHPAAPDRTLIKHCVKSFRCIVALLALGLILAAPLEAAQRVGSTLAPIRKTTTRGAYTIDTVGDTLGQSSPQNTRLIIRVAGADKKLIKPGRMALVDSSGAAIDPVFREDRKVGHEENTGLPLSVSPQAETTGQTSVGVGVNLNKVFGPHGDYAYTKVDWPKSIFTSDKRLQIVLSNGQSFVLPLSSIAK